MADKQTYLLFRNGEQVSRLITEIEFSPRLLPLREQFTKEFTETQCGWMGKPDTERKITPQDLDYDNHVEERKKDIFKYNRILFLLQGILDRSKVFSPHPEINLAQPDHVEKWFKPVFDEELGLPSWNPPVWKDYQQALNQQVRVGDVIYSQIADRIPESYRRRFEHSYVSDETYNLIKHEDDRFKLKTRSYNQKGRPNFVKVTKVLRVKGTGVVEGVEVEWPWGTRHGYEHKDSWGKGYHGKWGEWPVDKMQKQNIPVDLFVNISAYTPGDYKKFLCDAYLKGAYLKWAPYLLSAEKWWRDPQDRDGFVKGADEKDMDA